MTTEQCNVLIAEYMNTESYGGWKYPVEMGWCTTENLQYHSNWNWLMIATEKVSIEIDVEWNKRGLQHIGLEEAQRDITDALLGMQIEPVWEAVVKGIQVLNKLKEDEKDNN